MDSAYDRKFEEMKKYIPFLESMIKRLESTSLDSNPRQAQLDKIRSLRDLLMDKKKRMKMENLLKCEQVLVNLYAKVEQRDALPGLKNDTLQKEKTDLNKVRSKLKSVVSKLHQETVETLPEIARASDTEEVCVPGSKEPALFQRRPNVLPVTSTHLTSNDSKESLAKRNYTRVLISPEPSEKIWPANEPSSSEKQLFSRRSPKKSPRKRSPSYYKKERKKNKSKYMQSKDLNITLNVPEDSLNSLNTRDILSRIINCSDNDVDIATLRELRTQILGELKETGSNDDISDIILKSYKKKDKKGIKDIKVQKVDEIEEGELSDSESEAIESIYGSLVVLDKNKSVSMSTKDKEKPRKIQICLVINSEKTKPACKNDDNKNPCIDTSDFETFNAKKDEKNNQESGLETISSESIYDDISNDFSIDEDSINKDNLNVETKTSIPDPVETTKEIVKVKENLILSLISEKLSENLEEIKVEDTITKIGNKMSELVEISESNNLKPGLDEAGEEIKNEIKDLEVENKVHLSPILAEEKDPSCKLESSNVIEDIPLLEPTKQVSEIDILQALKKEILSETTNVLNSDTKVDTLTTPLLHQPKITKVANAQEIGSKKRISIESYKAKSVPTGKAGTRSDTSDVSTKEDGLKKQSLKLTEKECERFNFLTKLTLTESSDDEDRSSLSLDAFTDFAPKSPDHEDFADTGLKPPVIIPNDRVQTVVVGSETDVDMRKLVPNIQSNDSTIKPVVSTMVTHSKSDIESSNSHERVSNHLVDPRMKRDINSGTNQSPNQHLLNIESRPASNFITSSPAIHSINMDLTTSVNINSNANNTGMMIPMQVLNLPPNMPLNMAPGMTQSVISNMACPLIPNMTPSRTPNAGPNIIPVLMTPSRITNVSTTPNIMGNMTPSMTPSRHTFECDDFSSPKHVYAPMFSMPEHREGLETPRDNRQTEWNYSDNQPSFWDDGNSRNSSTLRDLDYRDTRNSAIPKDFDFRDPRNHTIQRDIDYRDSRNNSLQSNQSFDTRDSESMQFSSTPNNSYGILECPPTPTASFGIMEMPMTPIHPFGRLDCPSTPSHPFGRSEPLLPTPCLYNNQSVSRPYDPRINRSSDYESNHYRDDDQERNYYRERKFNSGNPYHSDQNRHNSNSKFRRFRDQSVGRNERNKNFETVGRNYRDHTPRRETSVGRSYNRNDRDSCRSFNREYDNDRYSRSRSNCGNRGADYRNHNDSKNRREKSVGRTFSKDTFSDSLKDSKERKFSENHKLNVQRHGGHSFTIDTSIKNTFQNTNSKNKSSFDSRRQRASSVGRTLLCTTRSNKDSNRETKEILSESHMKNRNKNFRRACSVGREIVDNDKLDFMDIKADLRSFKFKSDLTFSDDKFKTNVNRVSTSFTKGHYYQNESEKNCAEPYDKGISKYSPRKNNRDPRIRGYKRDDKLHRSNSQESKNYGIVYSNDNISKGTILGSGYGVKNYKIPKIKRQEVTEVSKTSENEKIDRDNKSSVKDKTSNLKQKDEKIDTQFESDRSENTAEKDNNVALKSHTSKYINEAKTSIKKNQQKENNSDSYETEATPIETTKTFTTRTRQVKKKRFSEINISKEIKNNDDDTNKEERKDSDPNPDTMSDSSEIFERRLTRSARRNMSEECKIMELSPIKKTRTSKKKPSVLESDSEDDKVHTIKTLNAGQQGVSSNKILNSTTKQSSHKAASSIGNTESEEKDINKGLAPNTMLYEESKEKSLISTLDDDKQACDDESNSSENNEKLKFNLRNEPLLHCKSIIAEKDKNTEDDLDSISEIDDLEMFPDNITSDPVIDSINALIANLDHDLDSSKSVELNSNFTKELNLETMLENLTSPGKNDKKEIINALSLEPELSDEQQVRVIEIEKPQIESHVSIKNHMHQNPIEHSDVSLNMKKDDYVKRKDVESEIGISQNIQEVQSGCSAILSSTNNSNDDVQNREMEKVKLDNELESYHDEKLHKNILKQQVHTNEIDAEDTCSNEAIVSTSDDGNFCQTNKVFKTTHTLSKTNDNISSTPDSTITTEENLELNSGPITNESTCEMNSDITSTHVVDNVDKDSLDVLTSDAGPSTQIESFGKLLSILQDKTKIKELLSLLGNQAAENEKLKKKLEKLSEIVSDDESITENDPSLLSAATNISSNYGKQDGSFLEVTQDAEELNKVNEGSESQNIADQSEKKCLSNCANLNIQEEKINEIKYVQVDDSKKTYSCDEQLISEINNITNADISNEFLAQENKIPAVPDILESDLNKQEDQQNSKKEEETITTKKNVYKKKVSRRAKKRNTNKAINMENRRFTRSDVNSIQQTQSHLNKPVKKKPSRELQKLQEDIREMFLKDDILSATGIRMCRIAKLVDETKVKDDQSPNEINYQEPLVVLKKCNDLISPEKDTTAEKSLKKKVTKSKSKLPTMTKSSDSKKSNVDPYDFETDSINESSNVNDSKNNTSSDSESDSGGSNKSIESSELLAEIKKKVKRKRGKGWKAGVIKPKNKKKKIEQKATISVNDSPVLPIPKLPDFKCFTDRNYCFRKNVSNYICRICLYNGTDIVHHYKKEHPHTEVPLSRMSPTVAKEAIKESEDENFVAISKISSKKYVCRFCYKEFSRRKRLLETFFWHIVSMHTGEYKQVCSNCTNTQKCPLDIDIPPPPKDAKGQLLGYICEKCNYTQISLENLKTHVIVWHNDEQTAVYTVNLAFLSRTAITYLLKNYDQSSYDMEQPRVLRSSRSNQSMAEVSNDESEASLSCSEDSNETVKNIPQENEIHKTTKNEPFTEQVDKSRNIQSKITFESDVTDEISHYETSDTKIKVELDTIETQEHTPVDIQIEKEEHVDNVENRLSITKPKSSKASDVFDRPHFKINYTESGAKEYICCINGQDKHYKTTLLISLKKHVQLKHSEKWDGYCCLCKVIVTPQGEHPFKDCLQHMLDKHIDNFPTLVETQEQSQKLNEPSVTNEASANLTENKSYINVRPISELISTPHVSCPEEKSNPILPVIESVISFSSQTEQPHPSLSYPATIKDNVETEKIYKYEEFQADIMSRKHRVVLESMMSHTKLVQIFKCAGRFCSFTTDNAENALLHASTHMRVGGVDSLCCVYCDFDSSGNAIDLITHVFKNHGCCQYVCGMCFYRAAASQQVNAHIRRVHEKATNVAILKTQLQTAPIQEDNILSREAAVPLYLCCDKSGPEPCKFRTYTPGKFCEHLQLRHASATEHFCSICSTPSPTPGELIRHLKTHGLKLYQCTWCVFGADNEAELMAHASTLHPARQPKAYLRIITNKEGSTELRVLPLAQLNKSDLPVTEVAPNYQKDFPVREAERSIELEKLIGHTNLMIESMSTSTDTDANEKEPKANIETTAHPEESPGNNANTSGTAEMPQEIPRMSTPSPCSKIDDQFHKQSTPIIKSETLELTPEKITKSTSDIVCLDSDDDTTDQNLVLDETDVNVNNPLVPFQRPNIEFKKVRLTELFVCPKCRMIIKCGSGFKKHINACYAGMSEPIPCVHCKTYVTKRTIVNHYNKHCDKESRYFCQECNIGFSYLTKFKEHQLYNHNTSMLKLASTQVAKGRRKRSLDARDKSSEPPDKIKRYGPQDIDKLPINPILDDVVVCSLCEFNTKVRLNMVRHLQLHAQQQPVPQTAPVNPVPHLETNEKHFDKMLNLASSSIVTRSTDKNTKTDSNSAIAIAVPLESLSRYPKYVPEKQRLTCGAKDCSYISVEESMFKCHWETLHSDISEFHCVHCPSYQYMDTVKPLTASRIVAHLKMHDDTLYACTLCPFYHNRRQILTKHLIDVHKGGKIMIVRDSTMVQSNISAQPSASQTKTAAPTMDLKPWQCGLCRFKSLFRPEVVDHCAKEHNSKMQYKCAYCAFRTSNPENITKHQAKSHVDKAEEIFYYYYREGSVSDEPDGTTRWQKQSQNSVPLEPKVKSEDPSELSNTPTQKVVPLSKPSTPVVDLNLVKKETLEPIQETIEDLCKEFGEFCEPNGLKYKCSLCSNVVEDNPEAMQSHLYEELKYRKWGCSICSYKAFHKEGLDEHMQMEHRQNKDPIALPVDNRVETWVIKLLEHQTALINKYKENLAIQKEEILRVNPATSVPKPQPQQVKESKKSSVASPSTSFPVKPLIGRLEKLFGEFGTADGTLFRCPKCNTTIKEESDMRRHLETELNKIRWFCSSCCLHFQTYHEAQFHCRSVHTGQSTRPVEVTRDGSVRIAWADAVINFQKLSIDIALEQSKSTEKTPEHTADVYEPPENSLLVVRYEENIPTPEEEMARKTPAQTADSDDEKLVIDEPIQSRRPKRSIHSCSYCPYETLQERLLRDHLLRHYGLKPYTCPYCGINGARRTVEKHQKTVHPTLLINLVYTSVPKESPCDYAKRYSNSPSDATKVVCLVCRSAFTETESQSHVHDKVATDFGKRGQVVVQCSVCYTLHKDVSAYYKHHKNTHPNLPINYVFSKLTTLNYDSKGLLYACSMCSQKFPNLKDIKNHAEANHQSILKYTLVSKYNVPIIDLDSYEDNVQEGTKRKSDDVSIVPTPKRTARKSTTKLPISTSFARKSTTKLPYNCSEMEEFSFYGTKPSNDDSNESVVTMMPFCNKIVPFTFNRLREIININPSLVVEKIDFNDELTNVSTS